MENRQGSDQTSQPVESIFFSQNEAPVLKWNSFKNPDFD